MEFDRLYEGLFGGLPAELPGRSAHYKMAPKPLDEARFLTSKAKDARKSGVLILFYPEQGNAAFPLIKRPNYPGVHSGQVALPGGKMEESDPDLVFTALREAQEEVGIDPAKVKIVGQLTELFIPASRFIVYPVIGLMEEKPNWIPDKKEVAKVLPTKVFDLTKSETCKETQIPIPMIGTLDTPFFDLHREIGWGATAMILGELVEVLKSLK